MGHPVNITVFGSLICANMKKKKIQKSHFLIKKYLCYFATQNIVNLEWNSVISLALKQFSASDYKSLTWDKVL